MPTKRLDNIGADELQKESINSLLGFWGKQKQTTQVTETVSHTEDLTRHGPCRMRHITESLNDYTFEQELLSWQSMRSIHQIALDMEQVFLARAYKAARKFCTYAEISAFITDACICHPSKVQRPKLEASVLQNEHADGSKMSKVRDAEPRMIISHGLQISKPSPGGHIKIATRNALWKDFFETEGSPALDEALRLVQQGESVFLLCRASVARGELTQRKRSRGDATV